MVDFRLFCPSCGYLSEDTMETILITTWFGTQKLSEDNVVRKCPACLAWFDKQKGRELIQMLTRDEGGE